MLATNLRCRSSMFLSSKIYHINHNNGLIVARYCGTDSRASKSLSLMQKYENYLEKNWPKAHRMHRMVIDGCKACLADVKTYYYIRRDMNLGKITLDDLNRQQLETYIQCPSELIHLLMLIVLLQIPGIGDILILLVIFFPRHVLTRHFWSKYQRKEYWIDTMNTVAGNHFTALISELPSQKHITFPVEYEKLKDIKVTSLDDLSFTQVFHLSRVHRFFPLSGLKNLAWRAEALRHLDNVMIQELHIIDEMKTDELLTQMNIRRLNFDGMSNDEMREQLKKWIITSSSISHNPSLYLHAPVLLQYNRKLIEQIRDQEKSHKI